MKFHDLCEMRQKILQAVIAWVRTVIMEHSLFLQFLVQRRGSLFETVVVILATVEINRELPHGRSILFCQNKYAVLIPVRHVDWFAKDRTQYPGQRRPSPRGRVEFLRGLNNQRCALPTHRRKQFWACKGKPQR